MVPKTPLFRINLTQGARCELWSEARLDDLLNWLWRSTSGTLLGVLWMQIDGDQQKSLQNTTRPWIYRRWISTFGPRCPPHVIHKLNNGTKSPPSAACIGHGYHVGEIKSRGLCSRYTGDTHKGSSPPHDSIFRYRALLGALNCRPYRQKSSIEFRLISQNALKVHTIDVRRQVTTSHHAVARPSLPVYSPERQSEKAYCIVRRPYCSSVDVFSSKKKALRHTRKT